MIPEIGNFEIKPILPNAVRAATVYGADLDVIDYVGDAFAVLDAIAQGSGITSDIKFQISPELALGSYYKTEGDTDKKLNVATSGKTKIGVQFTQTGARQVKTIALRLKRVGAIAGGKILTLTLNANSTGDPGTVLGTAATVLCSSIGTTAYEWVTFTFATPVDLADSTVYHIVLTSDYSASDTLYISWNALTVSSGGNCEDYAPSTWADVATLNLMFYAMEYNFADITGATFTQVGNVASLQSKVININAGRFIRAKNTVAGGSATGATSVNLVLRKKDAA